MELTEDIRRIAESPAGQRFKLSITARRNQRAKVAHDRFDDAYMAEAARHEARLQSLRRQRDNRLQAARDAFEDAEREFFRRRLDGQK